MELDSTFPNNRGKQLLPSNSISEDIGSVPPRNRRPHSVTFLEPLHPQSLERIILLPKTTSEPGFFDNTAADHQGDCLNENVSPEEIQPKGFLENAMSHEQGFVETSLNGEMGLLKEKETESGNTMSHSGTNNPCQVNRDVVMLRVRVFWFEKQLRDDVM